jgi:hypothetical protein
MLTGLKPNRLGLCYHKRALLPLWRAPTADDGCVLQERYAPGAAALLTPPMPLIEAQLLEHAFQMSNELKHTLICANSACNGYPWYDALPVIKQCRITATHDGAVVYDDALAMVFLGDHRINDATIAIDITSPDGLTTSSLMLDVVIGFKDENFLQLGDATILVTDASFITPEDLSDLLFDALFEYWQDCDADSYESQSREFREDALHRAYQLLSSRQAADLLRIENAIRAHILWIVPCGQQLSVSMSDKHCAVSVSGNTLALVGDKPAQ